MAWHQQGDKPLSEAMVTYWEMNSDDFSEIFYENKTIFNQEN